MVHEDSKIKLFQLNESVYSKIIKKINTKDFSSELGRHASKFLKINLITAISMYISKKKRKQIIK